MKRVSRRTKYSKVQPLRAEVRARTETRVRTEMRDREADRAGGKIRTKIIRISENEI